MKRINLLCMAIVAVGLLACKSTKTISTTATLLPTEAKTVKNERAPLIEQVVRAQPRFSSANLNKTAMEMNLQGRNLNVSSAIRLRTDSALYVSFQIFGAEIFKAELSPDSIHVFDKFNKKYYVVDYSYVRSKFGVDVDYYNLQSLLSAQFFCLGSRNPVVDSCHTAISATGVNTISYQTPKAVQTTTLDSLNRIKEVNIKSRVNSNIMTTRYSDYSSFNGTVYPKTIEIVANNDRELVTCTISVLKAEFNTRINFQALNPEKYTKANINQILRK